MTIEDLKKMTKVQLENRQSELNKEFEKNKNKLILAYKKMDEISIEYEQINEILKEKI